MVVLKKQIRFILRSKHPFFHFTQLVYAYLFRKKNCFISSKVDVKIKGSLTSEKPFYFGMLCNMLRTSTHTRSVLHIGKNGNMIVGERVRFSPGCFINVNGKFVVGDNTYINPNTVIIADNTIAIGSNCAISWDCQIMDTDIHQIVIDGQSKQNSSPVIIKDNVWIGSKVIITKGVTIGSGSVIAAGTVVTKSIPDNCMAAGNPAVVIRENISWNP